jgi:hypothetical protein
VTAAGRSGADGPAKIERPNRPGSLATHVLTVGLALACAPASLPRESAEAQIQAGLRGWFTALARSAPEAAPSGPHAGTPGTNEHLEFSLRNGSEVPSEGLRGWMEALRTPHARVEYRLAGLTISDGEGDVYRVRFALQRHAVDESGLAHIALSDQTWRIRVAAGRNPIVTEIAMEPRIAFPGTGPQIVCY